MNQSAYEQAFISLQQTITSLIQQASTLQGTQNQQKVDSIRQQLASVRGQIVQLTHDIEQAEEATLSSYRSQLGAGKDQFEALPETTQQVSYPTAYSALQAYKQQEALSDILAALNGDIMTVSHSLEQITLSQGTTPSTTDVNFDNDPAPHHLSP